MLTDPRVHAALELIEDNDFASAEPLLRGVVDDAPDDVGALLLHAHCLLELERFDEAELASARALAEAPELAAPHWMRGVVLAARHRWAEAGDAARRALQRDPDDPDYHALLAQTHAGQQRWDDALAAAQEGLALDPSHAPSANLRALALRQLGRADEAAAAFDAAARAAPLNAFAVAGKGWSLLSGGRAGDAAPQFRDALLFDPSSEWAREGLLASLKARNPVYRAMLRYFLWMDSRTSRQRVLFVVGAFVAYRLLARLAALEPALAPFVRPLLWAYVGFVVLSWTADPLFNLLLRFDPEGRRLLTREQSHAAGAVGGCLAAALAFAAAGVALGRPTMLLVALAALALAVPVAGTFQCAPGWPRLTMAAYTATVALAAVAAASMPGDRGSGLALLAVLGAALGSWVAAGLGRVVPRR